MRTQKELKEYYKSIDNMYQGEDPPEGWRFIDLYQENRPKRLKTYVQGSREWDYRNFDPRWVWITDLPLPDFAPEKTIQEDQRQTSKTEKQTSQNSKSKQAEQNNQAIQTNQTSMNKSKTYIVNYGPVNYEVPETALKDLFKADAYGRHLCFKKPFDIINRFLWDGALSDKKAEIKVADSYLVTTDWPAKYFSFPPPYLKTVKFVYRKNRDEINWRTLGVTEETDTYLCGIDLADDQFKKFLKEKILGGEVIEVADQQG